LITRGIPYHIIGIEDGTQSVDFADRMLLFFAGEGPQFKGGGFQIATPVGGTD
jgi:hypothetical protein